MHAMMSDRTARGEDGPGSHARDVGWLIAREAEAEARRIVKATEATTTTPTGAYYRLHPDRTIGAIYAADGMDALAESLSAILPELERLEREARS